MGAVRIVGKTFKVVGELLTAEAVENWVEEKIEEYVIGRVKDAASNAARRSQAQQKLASVLDVAGPFHVALENSLGQLSQFCLEAATEIALSGVPCLVERTSGADYVVAVPRDLISRRFQKFIVDEFKESVQLSEFAGLAETALATAARDAEIAQFEAAVAARSPTELSTKAIIVDTESSALWHDSDLRGHYYITNSILAKYAPDRKVIDAISALRDRIGRLRRSEHSEIISQFYVTDSSPPPDST
jgi:hypothetical protein